ncbi:hypothetical protein [Clavibacter michiganensis]|uniref:hypothetical protein n=1 Tax=Clavibacter michiganensis TaxID=28447 RepID=UPI00155646D9|nr:hypothetical protein [Clavibacter michiganensis]
MTTATESSNTGPEQGGLISEDVLRLGRALAAELDDTDTLGRWMAHHLSDLLGRRESSDDPRGGDQEIADLVLRFWATRAAAPLKRQPYLDYTIILTRLSRIDRIATDYSFALDDDDVEELPAANSDFERIGKALEIVTGVSNTIASGLLTELQLHAGAEEEAWLSYSALLSGNEADNAIRALLTRMVAASEAPEARRARLLGLVDKLAGDLGALRETIEEVGLAAADPNASRSRRPARRRANCD